MPRRRNYEHLFRTSKAYEDVLPKLARVDDVDALDAHGRSLLGVAAYYGHVDACRELLRRGASVDIVDASGATPIVIAFDNIDAWPHGTVPAAQLLLEAGPDLTASDEYQCTALHHAARNARVAWELVERLLEAGADPHARSCTGATPLMFAAESGIPQAVAALIAAGADARAIDEEGHDAIHHLWHYAGIDSARKDPAGCEARLVAAGASPRPPPEPAAPTAAPPVVPARGRTRLAQAIFERRWEVAREELAGDADINAQDRDGKTALLHLLEPGYLGDAATALFHALCERPQLDVRQASKTGLTPLHCATRVSLPERAVIEALLARGADPHARNRKGQTPIDLVKSYDQALREWLAAYEAR